MILLILLQAAYFENLDRPDGGYGWADEPTGHLTATWAAVESLKLLGKEVPRAKERAAFVRTHHPYRGPHAESRRHAAEIKAFVWQQIRTLKLLGEDPAEFAEEVRGWTRPPTYLATYEKGGHPLFLQEAFAVLCYDELFLQKPAELLHYLRSRRRPDGSYNNTIDGPGHIFATAYGLEAIGGTDVPAETAAWLRLCQKPSGGFTWAPEIEDLDGVDATWAGIYGLRLVRAEPRDVQGAHDYLQACANADGGFGPRPGRPSDPVSTYRALEALRWLKKPLDVPRPPPPPPEVLPEGLKVWTVQLQAPGQGSPEDAVEIARALKIHLWGAKNSKPGWIARAQAVATRRAVPVTFFAGDEEYGTFVSMRGFGAYSHVADLMAPAGNFGASMAGPPLTWEEFREKRIAPLEKAGGRMLWQLCDNEEFATVLLDDSLRRGGYAAISAFHMKQNFVDILPFVMRYRGALPFVSLQDAHGREPWSWVDDLEGHRTLFLAKEPTWEGWLEALKRDWVVAVRQDENTRGRARALGGSPAARALALAAPWRVNRPLAALAVVRPGDPLETPGPGLRVRVAWSNSPQGVLLKPLAELQSLTIDGLPAATRVVETKDAKGARLDVAHLAELPAAPGRHVAVAVIRTPDGATEEFRLDVEIP